MSNDVMVDHLNQIKTMNSSGSNLNLDSRNLWWYIVDSTSEFCHNRSDIIRVVLTETEMNHTDAVLLLREWERLARGQLATVTSPGQLFSPFEIPEDF